MYAFSSAIVDPFFLLVVRVGGWYVIFRTVSEGVSRSGLATGIVH